MTWALARLKTTKHTDSSNTSWIDSYYYSGLCDTRGGEGVES